MLKFKHEQSLLTRTTRTGKTMVAETLPVSRSREAPGRHRAQRGRHRAPRSGRMGELATTGSSVRPNEVPRNETPAESLIRERSEAVEISHEDMTPSNRKPLLSREEIKDLYGLDLGPLISIVYPPGAQLPGSEASYPKHGQPGTTPIYCFDSSTFTEGVVSRTAPRYTILTYKEFSNLLQNKRGGQTSQGRGIELERGQSFIDGPNTGPMRISPGYHIRDYDQWPQPKPELKGAVVFSVGLYTADDLGIVRIEDMGGTDQNTTVVCNREFKEPQDLNENPPLFTPPVGVPPNPPYLPNVTIQI